MIGIIAAMDVEIEGIRARLAEPDVRTVSGIAYISGKLLGKDCVIARCGVGKVNAAVCTQTMILLYHPDFIINTGAAGGIGEDIRIGDIVVADYVVQHDMDTTALGDEKGLISGPDIVKIPCAKDLMEKIQQAAKSLDVRVHVGTVATGDQFIGSADKLKGISEDFGASACEMEGASIGQVCYLNGVAFGIIRAISDNADSTAHMDFPQFVKMAAEQSVRLLCALVENLAV